MTNFRAIVTGSRIYPNEADVWDALSMVVAERLGPGDTLTVVHGDCPTGADRFAHNWCAAQDAMTYTSYRVVEERYPADWDRHGKAAGPIRNQEMVDLGADLVLAFVFGPSRGTHHCIAAAERAGIPIEGIQRISGLEVRHFTKPEPAERVPSARAQQAIESETEC